MPAAEGARPGDGTPGQPTARPAVLLDRDGVLNLDKGYVHRVEDLVLLPGVAAAVAALKRAGLPVVVVTNQSGVARGLFTEVDVQRFNAALNAALRAAGGAAVDAFYVCPHHPDGTVAALKLVCDCRKPKAGLLLTAARDLHLDLARSVMVGDRPDDVEAALAAGAMPIQVTATGAPRHPRAIAHVASLLDAVPLIQARTA